MHFCALTSYRQQPPKVQQRLLESCEASTELWCARVGGAIKCFVSFTDCHLTDCQEWFEAE